MRTGSKNWFRARGERISFDIRHWKLDIPLLDHPYGTSLSCLLASTRLIWPAMSLNWSRDQVAQEAETLARLVSRRPPDDSEARRDVQERLDRLRAVFRAEPGL